MKIFKRRNFFTTKKSYFVIFFLVLTSMVSCKNIDSNAKPDLSEYVLKPLIFISVNPPISLKKAWPELMGNIEKKLRTIPFVGKIVGHSEQKNKFLKNPRLKSKIRTYINTLSLTGISDKEIALNIEKEFGVRHFLFFDFLSLPCSKECVSDKQWLIRLKLIESRSGDLIFWVRKKHELSEDIKTIGIYKELANKLSLEVINEFSLGYIVPWHRWRYNHLKPDHKKI